MHLTIRYQSLNAGVAENSIRIIVVLYTPPSREELRVFRQLGGTTAFTYRHAVYGFAGALPANRISDLAVALGEKLCIIQLDNVGKLLLDDSVRHVRARPLVWDTDSGYGFDGDPNIVIGIIDSGIDDTHPDLAGRIVFWHDFSDTELPVPDDFLDHGTVVASVAAGTGESIGSGPISEITSTNMRCFQSSPGTLEPWPIKVPSLGSGVVTVDLVWMDTGTACMNLSDPDWNMMGQVSGSTSPLLHTWTITETGYYNIWIGNAGGLSQGDPYAYLVTQPYEAIGDGYNLFRGIAPECGLAGSKITVGTSNSIYVSIAIASLDSTAAINDQYNIKVVNCSWGWNDFVPAVRFAAQGLVTAGTVVICVGDNCYPDTYIKDPGLAFQVITVGAINDFGEITNYSSMGFPTPTVTKPDVVAPGGSYSFTQNAGTGIDAADGNSYDSYGFEPLIPDRNPNDYVTGWYGVSFAGPHVAGLSALVIEALEQTGYVWGYTDNDVDLVKSIILMTATETNKPRQDNLGDDPTLDRGGNDLVEGYGKVNADAAIEAVINLWGDRSDTSTTITFGENSFDRKCWATKLELPVDSVYDFRLYTNPNLDADLYVYVPDFGIGDPDIVVNSTGAAQGISEFITGFTSDGTACYLVAKHVSGEGDALLIMGDAPMIALSAALSTDELDLNWDDCPWASQFRVHGIENQPYFEPSPGNQLAVLAPGITSWSSTNGIGDPESNWTYIIVAVDAADQEIMRSNYCGELDFEGNIP